MKKLIALSVVVFAITLIIGSCKTDEKGSCSDGIKNQDETGVDCGGVCTACATCSDGIKNQGETEIDCGGPCTACPGAANCSANFDGNSYVATTVTAQYITANDAVQINTSNTGNIMTFLWSGTTLGSHLLAAGTFDAGATSYSFHVQDTGSVAVTSNDLLRKIISGTFQFSLRDTLGTVKFVQTGSFNNVRY